jgi:hypothetical protein
MPSLEPLLHSTSLANLCNSALEDFEPDNRPTDRTPAAAGCSGHPVQLLEREGLPSIVDRHLSTEAGIVLIRRRRCLQGVTGDPAGKSHWGPPQLKVAKVLRNRVTSAAELTHGHLMTT